MSGFYLRADGNIKERVKINPDTSDGDSLGIRLGDDLYLNLSRDMRVELYKLLIKEDRDLLFEVIEDEDYLVFPDMDEMVRAAQEMDGIRRHKNDS